MSDVQWNKLIVECGTAQGLKKASTLCFKHRIGILIVPQEILEQAIITKSLVKGLYNIVTTVDNPSQKVAGSDKFMGSNADIFDANGFQLAPMKTDDPTMLLQDVRSASEFLRDNLSQSLIIGWDLSNITLKDKETLALLELIANGYRPNYIRFNTDQGLICEIAKKVCATKTASPYSSQVESDYKIIDHAKAAKL